MLPDEQIRAIQTLGYGPREAIFLRLVALHSGYFVRRQLLRVTDSHRGKRDQKFLQTLLDRGHARREIFREDRHLFRLQSKAIYLAVRQGESRNRREHQPSTVRLRLMGLDFILDHPEYSFLMTPEDKLSHLLQDCGIDPQTLPTRSFRSGGAVTAKYFPDGFPQFIRAGDTHASFVYVDDPQLSADSFRSYLRNYSRLFEVLGSVHLIFLTLFAERFKIGQRVLLDFSRRTWNTAQPPVGLNRLLAHFPHRQLFENGDTRHLNTAQMRALAEDIHDLNGARVQELYALWKERGPDALRAELAGKRTSSSAPEIDFTSSVLEYDYDLFGTLHVAS